MLKKQTVPSDSSSSLKKRHHDDVESSKYQKNNKSQMFNAFEDDEEEDNEPKSKSNNDAKDDDSDTESHHQKTKKIKKQEKHKSKGVKRGKNDSEEEEEEKSKEEEMEENPEGEEEGDDGLSDYERETQSKKSQQSKPQVSSPPPPPPPSHPLKNRKTENSPKFTSVTKEQQQQQETFPDVKCVDDNLDISGVNNKSKQIPVSGSKKGKLDSQSQGNGTLDKFVTPIAPKVETVENDNNKEMVVYDTARVKRVNDMTDDVKRFSFMDKGIASCINISRQVMEMSEMKEKMNGTEAPTAISAWRFTLNRENYSSVSVDIKEKSKTANSSHTELNMDALIAGKRSSFMTPLLTVGVSTMTGAGAQPKKAGRGSANPQPDGGIINYGEFSHAITLVSGFVPNDDLLLKYKNLNEEQKDFKTMFISFVLLFLMKMWGVSNLKAQLKSQIMARYGMTNTDLNEMPEKTRNSVLKDWSDAASLPIQVLKHKVLNGQENVKENIITARKTFWPKQDTKNMSGRIVIKYGPFGLPWNLNEENMEYLAKSLSNHYKVTKQVDKSKEIDEYYVKLDAERSKAKKNAVTSSLSTPTPSSSSSSTVATPNKNEVKPPVTLFSHASSTTGSSDNKTPAVVNNGNAPPSHPPGVNTTNNTDNNNKTADDGKTQVPDVCYSHIIDVNINDPTLTEEKLDPVVWKIVCQRRQFYDMLAEMHSKGFDYDPPQVYTDKPDPKTNETIHLFDINRPERNILPSGSIVRARIHFRPHSTTQQFGVQAPHTSIFVVRAGLPSGGYAHTAVEESQSPEDILNTLNGVGLKRSETHVNKEQDDHIPV